MRGKTIAASMVLLMGAAHGYINPGTGTVIASSLWPMIVAFFSSIAALLIKHFWNPIKSAFSKLRGK